MFAAAAANIFSPSKNVCMVRVAPLNGIMRYRNDPYRAKVIASPSFLMASPMKTSPTSYVASTLPTLHIPATAPQQMAARFAAPIQAPLNHGTASVPEKATQFSVVAAPKADTQTQQTPHASPSVHYAIVQFKHSTSYYVAPFRVNVGDYVFVEGDRGENLGVVQDISTEVPSFPVPCKVTRRATQKDKDALNALRRKEAITTKAVSELADQCGFSARIVDTEFQFDGNKLTVFFASRGPVDFRKLQRGLFRDFRCRIWLVNWNEITPVRSVTNSPRQ